MSTERGMISDPQACGHCETLLTDALDGLLKPEDEVALLAHTALCPICAALVEEARRGREWLEFLASEPEVPAELLGKILAQTGPGQTAGQALAAGGGHVLPVPAFILATPSARKDRAPGDPALLRPGLAGQLYRYAEPSLLMTAAMAFFSIALTLNLAGFQLHNLRIANLRPSAVRSVMERRLTMASTPIVRYYDHLRLVNEVEARVRELRRTVQNEGQGEGGSGTTIRNLKDLAPGESKKIPRQRVGGSSVEPAEQSEAPAHSNEYLETSLIFEDRPADSGGFAMAVRERSTAWTV